MNLEKFKNLGNSSITDTHTITIEWIRHGEACTNLFENFAEDEYLDLETIQYEQFNSLTENPKLVTKQA